MKRTLSICLALALAFSVSVTAFAAPTLADSGQIAALQEAFDAVKGDDSLNWTDDTLSGDSEDYANSIKDLFYRDKALALFECMINANVVLSEGSTPTANAVTSATNKLINATINIKKVTKAGLNAAIKAAGDLDKTDIIEIADCEDVYAGLLTALDGFVTTAEGLRDQTTTPTAAQVNPAVKNINNQIDKINAAKELQALIVEVTTAYPEAERAQYANFAAVLGNILQAAINTYNNPDATAAALINQNNRLKEAFENASFRDAALLDAVVDSLSVDDLIETNRTVVGDITATYWAQDEEFSHSPKLYVSGNAIGVNAGKAFTLDYSIDDAVAQSVTFAFSNKAATPNPNEFTVDPAVTAGSYPEKIVYTLKNGAGKVFGTYTVTFQEMSDDRKALKAAIAAGETALSAENTNYYPLQITALETAITAGKVALKNADSTDEALADATTAINEAIGKLVSKNDLLAELETSKAIVEAVNAEEEPSSYAKIGYQAFLTKYNDALAFNDDEKDPTSTQVSDAISALKTAREALVETTELVALLADAKELWSGTSNSNSKKAALKIRIDNAETLLANGKATAQHVENHITALTNAMAAVSPVDGRDTDELQAAVELGNKYLDDGHKEIYNDTQINNLQTRVTHGQAVLDDTSKNQDAITNATTNILTTIGNLRLKNDYKITVTCTPEGLPGVIVTSPVATKDNHSVDGDFTPNDDNKLTFSLNATKTVSTVLVRINIVPADSEADFSAIQAFMKDTNDNWYDAILAGFGPASGFPVTSGLSSDAYIVASEAVTNSAKVQVVDVSTGAILAESASITVSAKVADATPLEKAKTALDEAFAESAIKMPYVTHLNVFDSEASKNFVKTEVDAILEAIEGISVTVEVGYDSEASEYTVTLTDADDETTSYALPAAKEGDDGADTAKVIWMKATATDGIYDLNNDGVLDAADLQVFDKYLSAAITNGVPNAKWKAMLADPVLCSKTCDFDNTKSVTLTDRNALVGAIRTATQP